MPSGWEESISLTYELGTSAATGLGSILIGENKKAKLSSELQAKREQLEQEKTTSGTLTPAKQQELQGTIVKLVSSGLLDENKKAQMIRAISDRTTVRRAMKWTPPNLTASRCAKSRSS